MMTRLLQLPPRSELRACNADALRWQAELFTAANKRVRRDIALEQLDDLIEIAGWEAARA